MIKQCAESYAVKAETLRSRFADENIVELKPPRNHTHPISANSRSSGSLFMDKFSMSVGKDIVYYQCSRADQRNNRLGSRAYYWAKDLTAAPAVYRPQEGDLVGMVDVDQYVDMDEFLALNFRPVILYTFQPRSVAKRCGEYCYTFNRYGEVIYNVSGGAEYRHAVWNYAVDNIIVRRKFCGITYQVATYLVDRKQVDEDHQLILLTPLKRFTGLSVVLSWLLSGDRLERFNPVQGDFLRAKRIDKTGVYISTGRVDEYIECTVPADVDSYIGVITRTSKVGLTLPQVKSKVENQSDAAVLYEFYKNLSGQECPRLAPDSLASYVRRYQFSPNEYDPDARPSMQSFMKPLIDGAFCPDVSKNNSVKAVQGRIENVRNQTKLDSFLIKVIDEFIEKFLYNVEKLVPASYDVVWEKQGRATQRRILMEAEFSEPRRTGKCFVKKEAYGKCSDPRIISTIDGNDKLQYSQYIYAFAEVLKDKPWYAFSKTPYVISLRVAEILSHAQTAGNTDFSRMDGHVSEVLRFFEETLLLRAFKAEYREKLMDLIRSQYNLFCMIGVPGKETHYQYDQGLARASGSPETSALNTVSNAFIAFLAYRMTKVSGCYLNAQEAYSRLGIYGGDDGVSVDIDPDIYVKAAKRCGQDLTIEMVQRGNLGITFLSRFYSPDVWFGDLNSMCDLKRALMKFHVTVSLPSHIPAVAKMIDKAYAYWLADENTPIIGEFVSTVVKFRDDNMPFKNLSGIWNAQFEKDVQYPNFEAEWMLNVVVRDCPYFDVDKLANWLAGIKDVTELLLPPRMNPSPPPEAKAAVVVDGDVHGPSTNDKPLETEQGKGRSRDRVTRKRGKPRRKGAATKPKIDKPK